MRHKHHNNRSKKKITSQHFYYSFQFISSHVGKSHILRKTSSRTQLVPWHFIHCTLCISWKFGCRGETWWQRWNMMDNSNWKTTNCKFSDLETVHFSGCPIFLISSKNCVLYHCRYYKVSCWICTILLDRSTLSLSQSTMTEWTQL